MAQHKALTPAEAAQQIIAQLAVFNVAEQTDEARKLLGIAEPTDDPTVVDLTGQKAIVVNELTARADELDKIAKAANAEREQIKDTLRDVLGDAEELKVNNALVFTNKRSSSRILDQKAIKSRFPDIPGNEWAYTTTETRRALFK
jgi:methyl-accepting chemotaxis protein